MPLLPPKPASSLGLLLVLAALPLPAAPWPEPTAACRPWTRWWWLGSAVRKEHLTRELETFRAAGIGGVEITAIYGVRGQEKRHIDYLSDRWLEMLRHTCDEAKRLGLEVDLPPGSGWRCGGAHVSKNESACFFGVREEDETLSLAFAQGRERVKRPGPGGAGLTIDVYDAAATQRYFSHFNQRLAGALPPGSIRAQFHDSFEYGGDWSRQLADAFGKQHGYTATDHLATLEKARRRQPLGETERRVVYDYRRTLEEMYLANFMGTWNRLSRQAGMLTRNQAHGSPANVLDIYAAADIPETEIFRDTVNPLVNLLASSAGHVAGRRRIACESFTWLSEHFQSDLGRLKWFTDYLFLCGVNHIVYHGTSYSSPDTAWPGRLFYASSQINPRNPIWRDLPALNAYMARCQSLLQAGQPAHDVLLFWPIDDDWMQQSGLRSGFSIDGGHWRVGAAFRDTAQALWNERILFDYISDRQLATARVKDGRIVVPGGEYRAIMLPALRFLRPATAAHLLRLVEAGGPVLSLGTDAETDAPGLAQLPERRAALRRSLASMRQLPAFVTGADPVAMLAYLGIRPESMAGARCERRRMADGSTCYFLANRGKTAIREWIHPSCPDGAVSLLDPWTGRVGWVERQPNGSVFLALEPRESRFLVIGRARLARLAWREQLPDSERSLPVAGPWRVSFIAGGPVRPVARAVRTLSPYTSWPEPELRRFAGTARYEATFTVSQAQAKEEWLLDLGQVHGSARVHLNGRELGVSVLAPHRVLVGPEGLRPGANSLAIEVTGLAANRIRDLDRRGVNWRIFHDINFVNINYRKFDASGWATFPAGLVGPVQVIGTRQGE